MINSTRPLRCFYCVVFITALGGCANENAVNSPLSALGSSAEAETISADALGLIVSTDQPVTSNGTGAAENDRTSGPYVVRKESTDAVPAEMPGVWLSTEHSALCRVRVGDKFPEMSLPRIDGEEAKVTDLLGTRATVVLCWQPDRWMTKTALSDLARDVIAAQDSKEVVVLGIAVKQSADAVKEQLKAADADFPQMLDSDGKAFNKLGMVALPRVYVLDSSGTIVWFDIEYSESTRRELGDAVSVLTANEAE